METDLELLGARRSLRTPDGLPRIKRVEVDGLFGYLDPAFEFLDDERVAIIFGINGTLCVYNRLYSSLQ